MSNSGRLSPDERREQILEIAAAHFAREGATGTSTTAIADEAGVTRALIYHYFPGKTGLFDAVLEREARRVLDATAPSADLSPRENLDRALNAYFDHFAASAGPVRELYGSASPLALANHDVQVSRLVAMTDAPDSPRTRLALSSWLAFVENTARSGEDVPRDDLLSLCAAVLESALGRPLPPSVDA